MTPSIFAILMLAGGQITGFEVKMFLLVAGAAILVAICWGAVEEWIDRSHARNWPTVSAVIDAVGVSLVESKLPSSGAVHFGPYYVAKLTYSYRNPEKRTGDYCRSFGNEDDAKAWANSYKGETVKVHVDPRDPKRSLLREEDL